MSIKKIIFSIILINLALLASFLFLRYKEYNNQKHNYTQILENIKSKIIRETENINFYSCFEPLVDTTRKNLVFYFSVETCQPCLEKICDEIKGVFPDYSTNNNIIFFSNDLEKRLRKKFMGKQITTSTKNAKQFPFTKYKVPLLFTLDSDSSMHDIFIADKDNPQELRKYLLAIKKRYFD